MNTSPLNLINMVIYLFYQMHLFSLPDYLEEIEVFQ